MTVRICNFGSINIDAVYRLPHIVRPGETLTSHAFALHAGGKGANQSVALARAGASVMHAGLVGGDGRWVVDLLADAGVDCAMVQTHDDAPTGRAIIQVDDAGANAIFLHPGANREIDPPRIERVLDHFGAGDVLLVQNEVSHVSRMIELAAARGLSIWLNPAPFDPAVLDWPLDLLAGLVVNETEAAGLLGVAAERIEADPPDDTLAALASRCPAAAVVLTLGARGAAMRPANRTQVIFTSALSVEAVDTTAAGDTFIGYLLAGLVDGMAPGPAMRCACRAAALCVQKAGAIPSIPTLAEVRDACPDAF